MSSHVKLRYVWLDGVTDKKRTPLLRSKTKILHKLWSNQWLTTVDLKRDMLSGKFPAWRADGSSMDLATPESSDIKLVPVAVYKDPLRNAENALLVLCEVEEYHTNGPCTVHPSNTRARARNIYSSCVEQKPFCAFEQEFVLRDLKTGHILGFSGVTDGPEQGEQYCGVGADRVRGREIVEEMLGACLAAGLSIQGENSEVLMGQWEFQVGGPGVDPLTAADELWLARYIMMQVGEKHGVIVDLSPKPALDTEDPGRWNGSGCHTNFSTAAMRESLTLTPLTDACERLSRRVEAHIAVLGEEYQKRLIGKNETGHWSKFSWGVGSRTGSVRIPAEENGANPGYIEDRRPNSNCDPYKVVAAMMETICLGVEQ